MGGRRIVCECAIMWCRARMYCGFFSYVPRASAGMFVSGNDVRKDHTFDVRLSKSGAGQFSLILGVMQHDSCIVLHLSYASHCKPGSFRSTASSKLRVTLTAGGGNGRLVFLFKTSRW